MLTFPAYMEDIVIIGNPNKAPHSARELLQAGFTWAISPAHYSCTGIVVTDTFDAVGCGVRGACTQRENNLRSAWAAALDSYADAPATTIFAEDDITPAPGVTKEYVHEFVSHPHMEMFDVVCLFNNGLPEHINKFKASHAGECALESWLPVPGGRSICDFSLALRCMQTECSGNVFDPYAKWCSHALWVHPNARRTLERLFRELSAPTDAALVHAALMGILRIGKLYSNVFFQVQRPKNPLQY